MRRSAAVAAAAVAALACTGFVNDGAAEGREAARADARPLVCEVFLSQYKGHTLREAALPYAPVEDRVSVKIARVNSDERTTVRVKEGGPWNLNDAYWRPRAARTWDLPRCVPQAQAAFYDGFNGGEDQFGREVLNPAAIDVTPAVAKDLGLRRFERGAWVRVTFPWVRR